MAVCAPLCDAFEMETHRVRYGGFGMNPNGKHLVDWFPVLSQIWLL